jgi:hypothetical protein
MRPGQVLQHRFVDMGRLIVRVPQAPDDRGRVQGRGVEGWKVCGRCSGQQQWQLCAPEDDAVDAFPVAQTGHDGRELLLRSRGLPSRWTLSIAPGHAGTRVPAPHPVRSEAVE